MKKLTLTIAATIFTLITSVVNADPVFPIEGDYSGRGEGDLSMKIMVLDNEKGIVAASVFTGIQGGCSGTIAGLGKFVGDTLSLKNFAKEEGAESCVVSVVFNKNMKSAKISETNCSALHGAACAFEGKLIKKR